MPEAQESEYLGLKIFYQTLTKVFETWLLAVKLGH